MNLNDVKIIFVDIDGTLVTSKKEITERTRISIKRVVDKGIKVVLVSGRDIIHTIEKSKAADASSIVISTNGAEIFDYERNQYIFLDRLSKDNVEKTWNYCKENKIGLILKTNLFVYYNDYSLVTQGYKYKHIDDISECQTDCIAQFLIMSNDSQKLNDTIPFFKDLGLSVTSFSSSYLLSDIRDYYSIDINNPNISKGIAITKLIDYLNIPKENALCFGDYVNDLEMFNACGIRVAMGNSRPELKEKADFITKTNDEDGVSYFLDRYL